VTEACKPVRLFLVATDAPYIVLVSVRCIRLHFHRTLARVGQNLHPAHSPPGTNTEATFSASAATSSSPHHVEGHITARSGPLNRFKGTPWPYRKQICRVWSYKRIRTVASCIGHGQRMVYYQSFRRKGGAGWCK
jgi:hypothetical protein